MHHMFFHMSNERTQMSTLDTLDRHCLRVCAVKGDPVSECKLHPCAATSAGECAEDERVDVYVTLHKEEGRACFCPRLKCERLLPEPTEVVRS